AERRSRLQIATPYLCRPVSLHQPGHGRVKRTMISSAVENELINLVWDMQHDRLAHGQADRLAELLANRDCRRIYLELVDLLAALEWEKATPSSELATPATPRAPATPRRWVMDWSWANRRTPFSLITAAMVIIAGLITMAMIKRPFSHLSRETVGRGSPELVARLTGTRDCEWSEAARPVAFGAHLFAGQQLDLRAGRAEITFYNG